MIVLFSITIHYTTPIRAQLCPYHVRIPDPATARLRLRCSAYNRARAPVDEPMQTGCPTHGGVQGGIPDVVWHAR